MLSAIERLDETLTRTLLELTQRPVASAVALVGASGSLLPEEEAIVAGAVEKRRNEFSAGRSCARRALASFECRPGPLLMGRLREPIWPPGFSGSITHDGRFAAALAYRSPAGAVWLSIDLLDGAESEALIEISDAIRHPAEHFPHSGGPPAIARLFSAKEAAIKIISPAIGEFVDFSHIKAVERHRGFFIVADDARIEVVVRTFEVDEIIVSLALAENI
jgi:4'-phosphopantetheinyl transferase EntD